jgi:hypothetical protein
MGPSNGARKCLKNVSNKYKTITRETVFVEDNVPSRSTHMWKG